MTQHLTLAGEQFAPGLGRAAVERLSDLKQEPAWLRERRLEAWDVYEQTPTPTTSQRDWKYTDITRLDFDRFSAFTSTAGDAAWEGQVQSLTGGREARAGLLVQRDSQAVSAELGDPLSERGLIVCSLD